MKSKSKFTYISLFGGAGIGCFGLKERGFECIATSELLKERIEIQKNNEKCLYNSGYVQGDILDEKIYRKLFDNINFWKINHKIDDVDLVIATPPCQGMSTANYKKNNEIKRNSLVVKAIDFIDESNPKIFVFENVKSFLKTICTDSDGVDKEINKAILDRLEKKYAIHSKIINFKNYGVPSSRPRTLVIGTRKDLINLSPLLLFPLPKKEIDLEKSILNLKRLEYGEFDKKDLFHFSRKYPI
jgi:DNA (cytosine-5)-methyltransferase 1